MTRPAATRQYPHVKPDLPAAHPRGDRAHRGELHRLHALRARVPRLVHLHRLPQGEVAPKEGGRARAPATCSTGSRSTSPSACTAASASRCARSTRSSGARSSSTPSTTSQKLTHEKDTLRTWAYSVPAPDPLEEGAVEPKEIESARKARDAVTAKAAAAAEQARRRPRPPLRWPRRRNRGPGCSSGRRRYASGLRPGPTTTAAARPADVEVEPGIDQATYDRLLAAGESDRTARAKAKAVYMRRAKAEARAAQATAEPPRSRPRRRRLPRPRPRHRRRRRLAPPRPPSPPPTLATRSARSPEGDPTTSGTAAEVVAPGAAVAQADAEHLEIEVDQETYDRLIEAGEPSGRPGPRPRPPTPASSGAAQRRGHGRDTGRRSSFLILAVIGGAGRAAGRDQPQRRPRGPLPGRRPGQRGRGVPAAGGRRSWPSCRCSSTSARSWS